MSRGKMIKRIRELSNEELQKLCGTRLISKIDLSSEIKPILSKSDIDNSYIYSEIKDSGYKKSFNWDKTPVKQILKNPELKPLLDKLLSFGGEEVCMPPIEEDFENILKYGQFWFGKGARFMKGIPCHCHENSCRLWEKNQEISRICTGYALSEDGIWRQHSWVINLKPNSNKIVETTVGRVAYFGFVMTDEQAFEFCANN